MEHKHSVHDKDAHFLIDTASKQINHTGNEPLALAQFDHNSERYTFRVPRYKEAHDFSVCNKVEVHFLNANASGTQQNKGLYPVKDLKVAEDDAQFVECSWLISRAATEIKGGLSFILRFSCIEDGVIVYSWNTFPFKGVTVGEGMNADETFTGDYADVIAAWQKSVLEGFAAELDRMAADMKADVSEELQGIIADNDAVLHRLLAVERARIDALLALKDGSTTGDAELQDIRIGEDGTTYNSAGTAVRVQFGKVKADVRGVEDAVYNRKSVFAPSDYTLMQKEASDFSVRCEEQKVYIDGAYTTASDMLLYVDATDCIKTAAVVSGGVMVYQYLHLFLMRTATQFLAVRFMGDGTARLQNVNAQTDGTFIGSAIETQNVTVTPKDGDRVVFEFSNAKVYVYVNDALSVAFDISGYGGKKIRGIWIPNYNAVETAGKAIADEIVVYGEAITAIADKAATAYYGKYHMSFDDVCAVFRDLTENVNKYDSIFENSFLAWLKKMHETYGVKFSLYCFYTDTNDGWTLEDATNAYAKEFKANADWLRFGFHARQQGVNYAGDSVRHDSAGEDYALTINALVNITGSFRCIDRMPRLHNYAGSLEVCKALRDAPCGCVGFLASMDYSADDRRDSYYFDEEVNEYMHRHDYYYDAMNQLHFVKTSLSSGYELDYTALISNAKYANINRRVELFTHENQLTDGMKSYYESVIAALSGNGYKSVFWMDEVV